LPSWSCDVGCVRPTSFSSSTLHSERVWRRTWECIRDGSSLVRKTLPFALAQLLGSLNLGWSNHVNRCMKVDGCVYLGMVLDRCWRLRMRDLICVGVAWLFLMLLRPQRPPEGGVNGFRCHSFQSSLSTALELYAMDEGVGLEGLRFDESLHGRLVASDYLMDKWDGDVRLRNSHGHRGLGSYLFVGKSGELACRLHGIRRFSERHGPMGRAPRFGPRSGGRGWLLGYGSELETARDHARLAGVADPEVLGQFETAPLYSKCWCGNCRTCHGGSRFRRLVG
jgi:hypothetical protein